MDLIKEQMQRHTITMEPIDWAVVHQIAKDMGLSSRSAGVRFIVRDWQRMKQAALFPTPEKEVLPAAVET